MNYDSREYIRARKRVKVKKGFFGHLSAYLAVSIFFLVINIATFDGEFWFFYPMLGWGIGLMIHYFSVFGIPGIGKFDADWEEREIMKELNRNRKVYREVDRDDDRLILKDMPPKERQRGYRNDEFV